MWASARLAGDEAAVMEQVMEQARIWQRRSPDLQRRRCWVLWDSDGAIRAAADGAQVAETLREPALLPASGDEMALERAWRRDRCMFSDAAGEDEGPDAASGNV